MVQINPGCLEKAQPREPATRAMESIHRVAGRGALAAAAVPGQGQRVFLIVCQSWPPVARGMAKVDQNRKLMIS